MATRTKVSPEEKQARALRSELTLLLIGGNAHISFEEATHDLPAALRGRRPEGCPHSAWELVEHMRIAQWDILKFTSDAKHQSPEWPSGYWPASAAPPGEDAWDKSLRAYRRDLKGMIELVGSTTDFYKKIAHGKGQNILREVLTVADHTSYHVGQLILVRKLLGAWK